MEDLQVKIKIEKQVMPAPSTLPLKKRVKREPVENKDELLPKRSTRSKTNQKNKQVRGELVNTLFLSFLHRPFNRIDCYQTTM